MKITLFKEELKYYLKNWKETTENKELAWRRKITDTQKKLWPVSSWIKQDQLCADNDSVKNYLSLPKEDGFDGKAVGSKSVSMSKKYFEDNENLHWPPIEDIVRLGLFLHLDFHKTTALILKMMWERYFKSKIWGNVKYNKYDKLSDSLKFNVDAAQSYSETFFHEWFDHDVVKNIYGIFEENFNYASKAGYDSAQKFKTLLVEIMQSELHLCATFESYWDNYIVEKQKEIIYSNEEYWKLKIKRNELDNEVTELFYHLEKQKKKNYDIKMKWMKHFGDDYLECRTLSKEAALLRKMLGLKKTNPDMTNEQLNEMAKNALDDEEKELANLQKLFMNSLDFDSPEMTEVSKEKYLEYQREIKYTLREIWRLTHTDVTSLQEFSEKEVEILTQYFQESMKIYDHTGFESDSTELSLFKLKEILETVKSMWENMGIEIPAKSYIPGEDLESKIEWLNNRITILENEKLELEALIKAESESPEIIEKAECLSSSENKNITLGALQNKMKAIRKELNYLEEECRKNGILLTKSEKDS